MKITGLKLCLLSFGFTLGLSAAEPSKEFINTLKIENEKIQTIVCPFNQEKHLEVFENPLKTNGTFYYQKDNKVCMSYDNPKGDLLLINGDQFVMITNGKTQNKNAQNKNKFGALKNLLFACFQGDLNSIGDCSFDYSEDSNHYIIVAEMKKKSRILPEKLLLKYDKKNFIISYMEMLESNGNKTVYILENKSINESVDTNVFHYDK